MACKISFFILLLFQYIVVHGQGTNTSETIIYSGTVTKVTDNTPLDSVGIYIEGIGMVGYTDDNGAFEVKVPANVSEMVFRKQDFIETSTVFVSINERLKKLHIRMFPEHPDENEQELIRKNYPLVGSNESSSELLGESLLKAGGRTDVPPTIRVLMPDNTIVVMNMDEYLKGVVSAEVPASWDLNALKAQAVAARSYASVNYKHSSQGADVCTTTHCQAWNSIHYKKTDQAVMETSFFSVKYDGSIIEALFFSHCNGKTRNNESVWPGAAIPYLRSVNCPCGFTFHNAHGVGMCQYGSQAMALNGFGWEEILTHYYTGVEIDKPTIVLGTIKGAIYKGDDNTNLKNRIASATIKLNTGQETVSGEDGLYSFDLIPGQYTITAVKDGFRSNSVVRDVTGGNTIWGSIQLTQNVGLSDVSPKNILIYPSPAKDILIIEPVGEVHLIISNILGHTEFNERLKEKTTINVSHYKRGIYIVKIIGADYIRSTKVVLVN